MRVAANAFIATVLCNDPLATTFGGDALASGCRRSLLAQSAAETQRKAAMGHIEARDIALVYATPSGAVPALRGINFGMAASEFLCIVGPSGCGKSTLLNIMAGFLTPTAGEIRIGGAPIKGSGMDRGVVFQDFAQLFPWRTALGNVAFGLEMKGMPKAQREAIALEQLRLVKLENFARSYPHHLSGGMQQRVAIARALAYNPAVLLMDEPFAALDALTRDDMQRLLAEVWRTTRKTVIYVTHNVAEAVYLADRVLVMTAHPGTIKAEVPIGLPRPRDPLSVEFLDCQKQLLRLLGQERHI
jgi:NitT/TauT family transport system ATP-binding protein